MGNLGRVFSVKILQKTTQRHIKVPFFPYKQVNGRNGDHDWLIDWKVYLISVAHSVRYYCWWPSHSYTVYTHSYFYIYNIYTKPFLHLKTIVHLCISLLFSGDNQPRWLRMTTSFILCDLVWKLQTSHAMNREGYFKVAGVIFICNVLDKEIIIVFIL